MPYKTYQTPPKVKNIPKFGETQISVKEEEHSETNEVKQEVEGGEEEQEVTETVEMNSDLEENGDGGCDQISDNNGEAKKRPWPQRLKDGGVKKLPKEVLKRRRNFRLKKMVTPKAPVMILHELVGSGLPLHYEVSDLGQFEPAVKTMPTLYMARVVHEGVEFIGKGPSKSIAKNIAAEQVLQFITTKSCSAQSMETEAGPSLETDTPWSALASLAMFKLFNDWQAQGYQLPAELVKGFGSSLGGNFGDGEAEKTQKQKKEKLEKEKAEKTLPDNHLDKHPVQLLNEMKGPPGVPGERVRGAASQLCVHSLCENPTDDILWPRKIQERSQEGRSPSSSASFL